jgi:hypothetical protein
MLVAMLLAVSVVGAICEVEGARYRLRGVPYVTAQFRDLDTGRNWRAGVAFQVKFNRPGELESKTSGRSYRFIPWEGGTADLRHMISVKDVSARGWRPPDPDRSEDRPLGDLDYVGTDAHYNVIGRVPHRDGTAPAHILLLNLGDVLKHRADEELLPQQFFDLVSCSKPQGRAR